MHWHTSLVLLLVIMKTIILICDLGNEEREEINVKSVTFSKGAPSFFFFLKCAITLRNATETQFEVSKIGYI